MPHFSCPIELYSIVTHAPRPFQLLSCIIVSSVVLPVPVHHHPHQATAASAEAAVAKPDTNTNRKGSSQFPGQSRSLSLIINEC